RALPRKHEYDAWSDLVTLMVSCVGPLIQCFCHRLTSLSNHGEPKLVMLAANACGVANVSQRGIRLPPKPARERSDATFQKSLGMGGQHQQLTGAFRNLALRFSSQVLSDNRARQARTFPKPIPVNVHSACK